jgi:hypothetical protein
MMKYWTKTGNVFDMRCSTIHTKERKKNKERERGERGGEREWFMVCLHPVEVVSIEI